MKRPLYHYEYVHEPFDDIIRLLADRAAAVLQTATDAAAAHAREVVTTLHVPVGRFEIGRQVVIDVGEYVPQQLRTGYVPISWRAEEHAQLFPRVEAKLEVAALSIDPPVTQVSLVGAYTPPFGAVGAVADDVVGHRVAEAAVHRFVEDVTHRIRAELAEARSAEPAFSMLDY